MPKRAEDDYADELSAQIAAWERKPGLRAVYEEWYRRIVAELSEHRPVVEIGSGCGNFKRFFPETIATDVIRAGDWIDRVIDARRLPYENGSVGNYVVIDCLHHLPRPVKFLRAAISSLVPGGRIVLFEPAITPWSRVVWKRFHHEPFDTSVDLYDQWDGPEPENPGFGYANMATAHLLFERDVAKFTTTVPGCRIVKLALSDTLIYPATGGFSYRRLLPAAVIRHGHRWERKLVSERLARWLSLRMLVVIEKD
jgi:SAM-dependent methyltransferase